MQNKSYKLKELALLLQDKFKAPCSPQQIIKWRSYDPPFPLPDEDGYYELNTCAKWVKKHVIPKRAGIQTKEQLWDAVEAKSQKIIYDALLSKQKHDEKARLLIERGIAERTILHAVKRLHAIIRGLIEREYVAERREKLLALGIDSARVGLFFEWDLTKQKELIDKLETEFAKEAGKIE